MKEASVRADSLKLGEFAQNVRQALYYKMRSRMSTPVRDRDGREHVRWF